MIASVLHKPVDFFLTSGRVELEAPKEKIRYDGAIYRDASVIVENLLASYQVPTTLEIIQEYTKATHDYAVKQGFSDPAMLKIYADGIIQGAIKAGVLGA